MPPSQTLKAEQVSPRSSTTPLISSDQRQDNVTAPKAAAEDVDSTTARRKFFGLGKKKGDKADTTSSSSSQALPPTTSMRSISPGKRPADLKPQAQQIPLSPSRGTYPSTTAASPSRLRSSSPRLHSPASSEIFERNVQEPVQIAQLQGELSPAHIPSHMITEDHIPPALEASAQAITSENLNADEVEIVMSASHQPAASGIEGSASHADLTQLNAHMPSLQHTRSEDSGHTPSVHQSNVLQPPTEEDGASTYGQLDPNDVRRLSFISFADVIQSEHQQPPAAVLEDPGNRDSLHMASISSSLQNDGAASPMRKASAPAGVTTPPPDVNVHNIDSEQQSPGRLGTGVSHGELHIETMRQAVRKTASGDLSGGRSAGMSPVLDENLSNASRSRTNS